MKRVIEINPSPFMGYVKTYKILFNVDFEKEDLEK